MRHPQHSSMLYGGVACNGRSSDLPPGGEHLPEGLRMPLHTRNVLSGFLFVPAKGGLQQRDCRGFSPCSLLITRGVNLLPMQSYFFPAKQPSEAHAIFHAAPYAPAQTGLPGTNTPCWQILCPREPHVPILLANFAGEGEGQSLEGHDFPVYIYKV